MKDMKRYDKWIRILSISVITIVVFVFTLTVSNIHLAKGTYGVDCSAYPAPGEKETKLVLSCKGSLKLVGSFCCPSGATSVSFTDDGGVLCVNSSGTSLGNAEESESTSEVRCVDANYVNVGNVCCPAGSNATVIDQNSTVRCVPDGVSCTSNSGNGNASGSGSGSSPSTPSSTTGPTGSSNSGTSDTSDSCAAGLYCKGQGVCKTCPSGYYCPGVTSGCMKDSSRSGITQCPSGTTSVAGSDAASDCKSSGGNGTTPGGNGTTPGGNGTTPGGNGGSNGGSPIPTATVTPTPTATSNTPSNNPQTGTAGIIVAWIVGLFAIVYSLWYIKRSSSIN